MLFISIMRKIFATGLPSTRNTSSSSCSLFYKLISINYVGVETKLRQHSQCTSPIIQRLILKCDAEFWLRRHHRQYFVVWLLFLTWVHKLQLRECLTSLPAQRAPGRMQMKSLTEASVAISNGSKLLLLLFYVSLAICGVFSTQRILATHNALSCHRMFDVRRMKCDSLIKWNYIFITIYAWVRLPRTRHDELSKLIWPWLPAHRSLKYESRDAAYALSNSCSRKWPHSGGDQCHNLFLVSNFQPLPFECIKLSGLIQWPQHRRRYFVADLSMTLDALVENYTIRPIGELIKWSRDITSPLIHPYPSLYA